MSLLFVHWLRFLLLLQPLHFSCRPLYCTTMLNLSLCFTGFRNKEEMVRSMCPQSVVIMYSICGQIIHGFTQSLSVNLNNLISILTLAPVEESGKFGSSHGRNHPKRLQHKSDSSRRKLHEWREVQGWYKLTFLPSSLRICLVCDNHSVLYKM